jgi:hypothetical protein
LPILSKPRHEAFAQHIASGKSGAEAYALAFERGNDGTARSNAHKLLTRTDVIARIDQIRAEHEQRQREATQKATEKLAITVESLIREAEAARVLAMQEKQPSAAIAAIKEKGVLAGIRMEKSERRNSYADLSDEELDRQLAEALRLAGMSPEKGETAH